MIWFYLPFVYLISSRLKSKFELISWQIIFIIPQLLITYHFLDIRSNIFIHFFLVSQLIFYSLYETGYIENDVVTTQKEKNPTVRFNKKNIRYITKKYSGLIYTRYYLAFLFLSLLFWMDTFTSYSLNLLLFSGVLILTKIIFKIHNLIRNRFTIITFFLLSILKYAFPIILFINPDKMIDPILLVLLIFPILRTIEVITLKRYNFKSISKLIGNVDKFRIFYYFLCLVSIVIIKTFSISSYLDFYISFTILLYFLIFRIGCFYLIKYELYKRNEKK